MVKTITIADRKIIYRVIHRRIKYPRLEFKTGELRVILPQSFDNDAQLVCKYQKWIMTKIDYIQKASRNISQRKPVLNRSSIELKNLVNKLIDTYFKELKLRPNMIFIRSMSSKWASLSANHNLTLNSSLKQLPCNLIEYIIFHEMVHLIERRHNSHFWSIINSKYKNHNDLETALFEYWFLINKK